MELVDDEGEDRRGICRQPVPGAFEHLLLVLAHEHHVQHRVVRDQDVRRRGEEVLAVDELVPPGVAEKVQLLPVALRGDGVELLLELEDLLRVLREPGRGGRRGGTECRSRVPTEPEPCTRLDGLESSYCATESHQLVLDEGVGRVQDHRAQGRSPVLVFADAGGGRFRLRPPSIDRSRALPGPRLLEEAGQDREEEGLGLARARSGRDHDVRPIARTRERVLEGLGLVVPEVDLLRGIPHAEEGSGDRLDSGGIGAERIGDLLDGVIAGVAEDRLEQLLGEGVVRAGDQIPSCFLDPLVTEAERRFVVGEVGVLERFLQGDRRGGSTHELILR